MKDALRVSMIRANEFSGKLRCLIDQASHKLIQKLYTQYISEDDFSHMPAFAQDMDKLLIKYGALRNNATLKKIKDVDKEF